MRATLCIFCLFLCSPGLGADMPYDIVDAARRGDDHAVRKLLEGDAGLAATRDERGYTPLHWAGIRAHWFVFRQLLDAGAPVDAVGGDGGTPLHWACHHDRADMVRLLVDRGADIGIANQWGRTPAARGRAARMPHGGGAPARRRRRSRTPRPRKVGRRCTSPSAPGIRISSSCSSPAEPTRSAKTRAVLARAMPRSHVRSRFRCRWRRWRSSSASTRSSRAAASRSGARATACTSASSHRIGSSRSAATRSSACRSRGASRSGATRAAGSTRWTSPSCAGPFTPAGWSPRSTSDPRSARSCHLASEHGGPYLQWIRSRHGAAYWRFATDWAALLAAERPAYRDVTDPIRDRALPALSRHRRAGSRCTARPRLSIGGGRGVRSLPRSGIALQRR